MPRARPLSVMVLAAAVLCAGDAVPGPRGLSGVLRRVYAPPAAPAWLQAAVCARAPELPSGCEAVALAIHEETRAAAIDPVLVLAMVEVESRWNARAVSHRGARGLMQLAGPTAAAEGRRARTQFDPHDPVAAIRAGVRYYARLTRIFGRGDLALVAYNAGPNRLGRHLAQGTVPSRFLVYPRRVRAEAERLREVLGAPREELALSGSTPAGAAD